MLMVKKRRLSWALWEHFGLINFKQCLIWLCFWYKVPQRQAVFSQSLVTVWEKRKRGALCCLSYVLCLGCGHFFFFANSCLAWMHFIIREDFVNANTRSTQVQRRCIIAVMCKKWLMNFFTCFIFATCFLTCFLVLPQKVCAKLEEATEISCLQLCVFFFCFFFYWSRTWFKGQRWRTTVFCCGVFVMVTQCQTVSLSSCTVSWLTCCVWNFMFYVYSWCLSTGVCYSSGSISALMAGKHISELQKNVCTFMGAH